MKGELSEANIDEDKNSSHGDWIGIVLKRASCAKEGDESTENEEESTTFKVIKLEDY